MDKHEPKHERQSGHEPIPGNGPGTLYWMDHPCTGTFTGWYEIHPDGWAFWRDDLRGLPA